MSNDAIDNTKNSGSTIGSGSKFPNPFCDIASTYIPETISDVLEWCEYLYLTMGTYRSASRKVVRYFITELQVTGLDDDELEDFKDLMTEDIKMYQELAEIGDDFMTYGNSFVSVYLPFTRFLDCPECQARVRHDKVDYEFDIKTTTFKGKCLSCAKEVQFKVKDMKDINQKKKINITRWNPKQIKLRVHPVSQRIEYYWDIPESFVKKIEKGNKFYIGDTQMSMLECMADSKSAGSDKRHYYKFNDGSIYHLKESTLAGVNIIGWGIPPILPNFKLAYYIQVLRRYDEAIALDYIVPFRVLYPEKKGGSDTDDPIMMQQASDINSRLENMVKARRKDPTSVAISPFPVGYQTIGGEGQRLAPKETIEYAVNELLNAIGYPAELYNGSLTLQAAPTALRLFEQSWSSLVRGLNDIVNWTGQQVSGFLDLDEAECELQSVTLADDIERKAIMMNAGASMDVSKQSAYGVYGIDYLTEQDRIIAEQKEIQELQMEAQEEAEAARALGEGGGGAPAEGAPPGTMQPGATPGDMNEQADMMAQQLLTADERTRRSELINLKQTNPTLHAMVKQKLTDMRQEAASQGQQQVISQMAQGG